MGLVGLAKETTSIRIGVDLGKTVDYTGFCVAEAQIRDGIEHHMLRKLGRAQLGTDYVAIAARIVELNERAAETIEVANKQPGRTSALGYPEILIDVTGLGGPFLDFFLSTHDDNVRRWKERQVAWKEELCKWAALPTFERRATPEPKFDERRPADPIVIAVSITSGDRDTEVFVPDGYRVLHVGKEALVNRLQVLFGTGCIHGAKSPEMRELRHEMEIFKAEMTASKHTRYGAPTGEHDDLLIATALAVWQKPMTFEEQTGVFV